MRGRKKSITVSLTPAQRGELEAIAKARVVEVRLWQRARGVLHWADGRTIPQMRAEVGLGETMLREWVKRYKERGLAGLKDLPGRGRKPFFPHSGRRARRESGLRTA